MAAIYVVTTVETRVMNYAILKYNEDVCTVSEYLEDIPLLHLLERINRGIGEVVLCNGYESNV